MSLYKPSKTRPMHRTILAEELGPGETILIDTEDNDAFLVDWVKKDLQGVHVRGFLRRNRHLVFRLYHRKDEIVCASKTYAVFEVLTSSVKHAKTFEQKSPKQKTQKSG